MSNKLNISFDLETWGNRPGSDIRSIGACVFHPDTGWIYPEHSNALGWRNPSTFYAACDNPRVYLSGDPDNEASYGLTYDLKRDPKTVKWWSEQSQEAQAAFDNPTDLRTILLVFAEWLWSVGVNRLDDNSCKLWSHGAAYDTPILSEAYHILGIPVPWHYRAPRDTRTTFDDASINDHSQWMKLHQLGTFHHALDDARSQAWAICDAQARIQSLKKG